MLTFTSLDGTTVTDRSLGEYGVEHRKDRREPALATELPVEAVYDVDPRLPLADHGVADWSTADIAFHGLVSPTTPQSARIFSTSRQR